MAISIAKPAPVPMFDAKAMSEKWEQLKREPGRVPKLADVLRIVRRENA